MRRLGACIFTYGTLMSGESNHRFALDPDHIEPAHVQGKLYSLGAFPALVVDGGCPASPYRDLDVQRSGAPTWQPECARVKGELFWYADDDRAMRAMRLMDQIEGFEPGRVYNGYTRVLVPVELSDGTAVLAWTYTLKHDEVVPETYLVSNSWR